MSEPRDAGDGDGWSIAIDWLLNSRYMDPEALEHFWHRVDEVKDCRFCFYEFQDSQWAVSGAFDPGEDAS